MKPSQRD